MPQSQISDTAKCTIYSQAAKALNELNSKQVQPDVIFLDLNMPLMNGEEFLKAIKKTEDLKDIPVIIFTVSSDNTGYSGQPNHLFPEQIDHLFCW